LLLLLFFFFFQAEDGIRDFHVTGVQTCALPISGGGLVEAYPHDLPEGKRVSASFLYNATRTMYERLGFSYERPKGKGNCVMSKEIGRASCRERGEVWGGDGT